MGEGTADASSQALAIEEQQAFSNAFSLPGDAKPTCPSEEG